MIRMATINNACGGPVPPTFVFNTTAFQNSANTVYNAKKDFDANPVNVAAKNVYRFKSDYERMQYKIGLYGLTAIGKS
jgi:hypothetical protein